MKRSSFLATASAFASIGVLRSTASAADPISWKISHNLTQGHPLHYRLVQMAHAINDESRGRLAVAIFPNNQLGNDPSVLTQVRSGAVQAQMASGGLFGSIVPVAQIENVGFAWPTPDAAFAALDGPLGAYIRREAEAKGLVLQPKIWDNGFRQVTTSTKPVRTVADLAGLKLRTPPGRIWIDLFRALGASPTPIAGAELYTSLQTHLVDGQENALAGIEATRLYEVQKYLSRTNHMFAGYWMITSVDSWRALAPDLQAILTRNQNRFAVQQRRDVELLNASLADKLQRLGLTFVNNVDIPSFRARLGGFYSAWKTEFGTTAWGLLEASTPEKFA